MADDSTARILRKILASLDGAVFLVDKDGRRVVDCNEAAEAIFGYSRRDLIGQCTRTLHVDDAHYRRFGEISQDVLRRGESFRGDFVMRRADGQSFPTRHVVTLLEPERQLESPVVSIVYDISAETESRHRLETSEERFRQIAESIADVFWVSAGPDQRRLEYVSPAYARIWGREPEALYRDPGRWLDTLHPEDRDRVEAALARQTRGPYEHEYRILRPDGEVRWILDRAFPVRGDDGQVSRIIGVARDVTQRRGLEEQLRQSQKMEAVGQLAGGVAHDFNNLLTVIQGHIQMALGEAEPESQLERDLRETLKAARIGANLTRQLLSFSRRQFLEEQLLDLARVVSDMDLMLRRLVPERIRLSFVGPSSGRPVRSDPTQVQQVVMNLVVNAVDAIQGPGTITLGVDAVTLSRQDARTMQWKANPGRYARLTVSDTGSGIPPAIRSRIFEPFFTTKAPGKGTGLGLSMVYGMVKQSGGHITVDSEPGQGTSVELLLPLVDPISSESALAPD